MRKTRTGLRKVTAENRQVQALQLRLQGHSLTAIAERLGYKQACGASAAIVAAIQKARQEPAEHVRELELTRLDALLERLWLPASKGDMAAVDRILKIMDRRARYLGLDAPVKTELSGPQGGPIKTQGATEIDLDACTVEELRMLKQIAERNGNKPDDVKPAASGA